MAECGKGWTGRCSAAKGEKCRCRCGGANHGATRQKFEDDSPRRSSDEELYQDFKWRFIGAVDQEEGGEIPAEDIREWVRSQWAKQADKERKEREENENEPNSPFARAVQREALAAEERVARHRTAHREPGTAERIEVAEGEFKL